MVGTVVGGTVVGGTVVVGGNVVVGAAAVVGDEVVAGAGGAATVGLMGTAGLVGATAEPTVLVAVGAARLEWWIDTPTTPRITSTAHTSATTPVAPLDRVMPKA